MHGNSQRYFKVPKNVVTATLFKGTLFGLFKKMFRLWRKDLHIKRIYRNISFTLCSENIVKLMGKHKSIYLSAPKNLNKMRVYYMYQLAICYQHINFASNCGELG